MPGRQSLERADRIGPDYVEQTPSDLVEEEERAREVITSYAAERDHANQLLGEFRAMNGVRRLLTVSSLLRLREFKESRAYRALGEVKTADGSAVPVTNWATFCAALGLSRQQVDEDLLNLNRLGAEALESLHNIGLGYRELRKLRQLPEDVRQTVINGEAVQMGDPEDVAALIEQLHDKHAKELEQRDKREKNLAADLEASRKLLAEAHAKNDELVIKLDRRQDTTALEYQTELAKKFEEAGMIVAAHAQQLDRLAGEMYAIEGGAPEYLIDALGAQVQRGFEELTAVVLHNGLRIDIKEILEPSWLKEETKGS